MEQQKRILVSGIKSAIAKAIGDCCDQGETNIVTNELVAAALSEELNYVVQRMLQESSLIEEK